MNHIHDYDPSEGQAYQGDVAIVPVPDHIKIDMADEMQPRDGRLILAEGEVTGHHHAIRLDDGRSANFHQIVRASVDPLDGMSPGLKRKFAPKARAGVARMYRDANAIREMVSAGILERTDFCIGFLNVEGAPVVLRHDEHDGIRIPEGRYYIGRQIESVGAEERRVED